MAKDYFQDIIPPAAGSARKIKPTPARTGSPARRIKPQDEDIDDTIEDDDEIVLKRPIKGTHPHHASEDDAGDDSDLEDESVEEEQDVLREEVGLRGIRNINLPSRGRPRPIPPDPRKGSSLTGAGVSMSHSPRSSRSRLWIWLIAGALVLVVALFGILATRPTVVTVTPRSHQVTFDQTTEFTAYPETSAASGTLPYSVQTIDLDDSEVIPAQGGTTHVETKASGSITVYNTYSSAPVKLIATTRFETPDHLIFRTPNDIVVPGKKGSTPGQVNVTVIADQTGQQYNVNSGTEFTLPGLKSNDAMYKGVHAQSPAPLAGGFSGDKTATDPAARATATANIRTRLLQASIQKATDNAGPNATIFYSLAQTTYQDLPDTNESNGVGIHVRIHSVVPILSADIFAQMVGSLVTADAETAKLTLMGNKDTFGATSSDIASGTLGTAPFHFKPTGDAVLIWNVDKDELSKALAGRDQASFKSIIANFPGIESARARIEPFWKGSFPTNQNDIKIDIKAPQPASGTAGA
ncbi:hypothetical protein HZC00_04255 [Candidatus Kaiserbacteria bacterium]|nr:hypothetical protein [Candidatus Kaiserbacteria bacterium]